jgi:hypothetical protein
MDDFVVYIHYTLDTNEPFYVGEGRLRRSTTNSGRNIFWQRVFKKHGKRVEVYKTGLTKKEAQILESQLVEKLLGEGARLTNIIDCSCSVLPEYRRNPRLVQWNKEHRGELSPTWGLNRPDLAERNKNGVFKRHKKSVQCIETGQIFESIRDASIFFGRKPTNSNIIQQIKGDRKTAFGHTWRYVTS